MTVRTGVGTRLQEHGWTAVVFAALLFSALAALAAQASPAFAQDETLTVTKTGMGTVTSDPAGINCGSDCTEPYPSSTEEICLPDGPCRTITTYQSVTLTASPDPGWAFQSWSGGGCSGAATTCTVTVNEANESVNATFIRISPPNDDFAAAQLISGANTSVNGTTKDATRETGEPDHSSDSWSSDHTVWYRWTAPHTGQWEMDTCTAAIDSILTVYTGNELNALSRVAENNNGCSSGFGSKVSFRATSGTTYRIVVGDAGGAMQNTFTLALASIPAPSNDNFANAEFINGASASKSGTNVSATRESSDPWSGTTNADRSVWYRWTAPYSGEVTLDTCTTNFDTLLSASTNVWWGLEQVAYNNNSPECPSGTYGSWLTFNATNGQTYNIGVDGCCGAPQGTFTLTLDLVDDVKPETTIHTPQEDEWVTSNTSATFTFDATEPDSSFECRVYGSGQTAPAFGACSAAGLHTQGDLNSGTYTFDVRATDPRGNTDQTPATRTWTVDTEPPGDGTVVINGGAAITNDTAVNLALSATDPSPGSGVTRMRFSNNHIDWSVWENYATSKSWNLSDGNGMKTVYVEFRDAAGNKSQATDAIKLDTTAPTATGKPTGKKVSPRANVIATFSEAMNEASVEKTNANDLPTTFTLKKKGTTRTLAATVVYSEPTASTFKAVLNPSGKLRAGATYIATVSSAATDLAGNPLVKKTWKFTIK